LSAVDQENGGNSVTELGELAIQFLRDLVRFDTTNPPGNELPAAQYIASTLRSEGIDGTVLESAAGRGNVVARLRGDGSAPPLLLMSHLDVVPAEVSEWSYPPFAAEVDEGYIWGRGTTDTKNLTALQMAVLILLKRGKKRLQRDVILAATADEETGGVLGMEWLVNEHPDLVACEYAINEGGGFGFDVGGRRFYVCQTGEKGVCWMKLSTHGTPGHGAMPRGDNAVAKLCAAVARLSTAHLPQHRSMTVDRLVHSLASAQPFPASLILPLLLNPRLEPHVLPRMEAKGDIAAVLAATLHNTVSPTVLRAGQKTNVIPGEATAEVDGRLVPGQTPDDLLHEMQPYLGDEVQVEFLTRSLPYESTPDSPLFDLFQKVLQEHDAGCRVVPYIVPGGTDGRFLAQKGVKVYGFVPTRPEPGWNAMESAHARNERLSLANMEFGAQVLYDIVRQFCGHSS
jgi:acetylornithine deacetylase/succinyl-diaminopimelate desuccinylase-like protein